MSHIPKGVLRRLLDEPFAVPDRARGHLESCQRCAARRQSIADDAETTSHLLAQLHTVPDSSAAWRRFRDASEARPTAVDARGIDRQRRRHLVGASMGSTGVLIAGALVVATGAAAASLISVFAPTRVAPVQVSNSDVQAISTLLSTRASLGIGEGPSGSRPFGFGGLTWTRTGTSHSQISIANAEALTGLSVVQPKTLPSGVGGLFRVSTEPRTTATVTLGHGSSVPAALAGSVVSLSGGPAVLLEYGSRASGLSLPTLGIVTMVRPTATSTGASAAQIENFLLVQPGFPPGLAEEIRLLGTAGTVLPVPSPPHSSARSVDINGAQGVLISDSSGSLSGVIWEDSHSTIHVVAGVLNSTDVLSVARQIGK